MKRYISIGLITLVVVTAPWWLCWSWLAGSMVYGRFDQWRYAPTTQFNSAKWQAPDKKYRYAVLSFAASNVVSRGMTQKEVSTLLGKPDTTDTNGNWQYETKRPGWRLIDFSGGGLSVHFRRAAGSGLY